MKSTSVLSAAALCLVSACTDTTIPVQPSGALRAHSAVASARDDGQLTIVDPTIAEIQANAEWPEPGEDMVVATVELLHDVQALHDAPATLILANDRLRLLPSGQWVPNDPRRGGRRGLTWGYVGFNPIGVGKFDPALNSVRAATAPELTARIVEGMNAWESRQCSSAPITRLFPGGPATPDIFQVGWVPRTVMPLFQNAGILGLARTFIFVDPVSRAPTDIDGNGLPDVARVEIYYNAHRIWSDNGPIGTIDMYSVIAHESGHAFGLNHFGKVFVTRNNVTYTAAGQPIIDVKDIKYAPKALMNAVYVMGRTDIMGTDHSAFCQIWASQ